MSWLKNLLGRGDKEPEPQPGLSLADKYVRFQTFLSANGAVLHHIADMQAKASEGFLFDMAFVRSSCAALTGEMRRLVRSLVELCDGQHAALATAAAAVEARIQARLDPPRIEPGPLSHALGEIPEGAFQVGGKADKLGRLTRAGLPVPAGFVITAYAQKLFFERANLAGAIHDELGTSSATDMDGLRRAGAAIRERLLAAALPAELLEEIERRAAVLGPWVAVRSSAIHEDSHFSFAGQFDSALHAPRDQIALRYKDVLASQFTPRALYYCNSHGFSYEEMGMGVLVMDMVQAVAAGVFYSVDPVCPDGDRILNAVRGLGTLAVGGDVSPDVYRIDREDRCRIEIGDKARLAVCLPAGGTEVRDATDEERRGATLTEAQAREVARLGSEAQALFGAPQDMEWAFDDAGKVFVLQSRPLRVRSPVAYQPPMVKGVPVLIDKATIASRGTAAGPIVVVRDEPEEVPAGCVLVARSPALELTVHVGRIGALVCEVGSTTSHLATVLREAGVPALFGAPGACALLEPGVEVTVDAHYGNVYRGRVEELLTAPRPDTSLLHESRPYLALKAVLSEIVPLNLPDPRASTFRIESCRTVHDVTRFAHEMAMRSMFTVPASSPEARQSKRLVSEIPLEIWVVDLDRGLSEESAGRRTVTVDDVRSRPFLAYWRGVTGAGWKGPKPMDLQGFMSVVLSAGSDGGIQERLAEKNYALLADQYVNLANRMGYHFAVIDSYLHEPDDSHVTLTFYGGGADITRRVRRVEFLSMVLKHLDFRLQRNDDFLTARIDGYDLGALEERLEVLGRLMMVAKQLDMVMFSDAAARHYAKEFISHGYDLDL